MAPENKTFSNDDSHLRLHVAMFPFFAFGHISPFAQLSNKLISSHGLRISFFTIPGFIPRLKTLIAPAAEIVALEIPPELGLPADVAGTADLAPSEAGKLVAAMDMMRPQVEALLAEMRPDFVLFDFAQHWMPRVGAELGVRTMFFSVFTAIADAFFMAPNRLDGIEGSPTVEDLVKPPNGFPVVRNKHNANDSRLIKTYEARKFSFFYQKHDDKPRVFDKIQEGITGCCAYVIKTCNEMEGPYLEFFKSQLKKPFILTGPLVAEPLSPSQKLDRKWADWLCGFEENSVVFCSFGSETFLTRDQIRELALGLELTGQPFFLVLNFPRGVDSGDELEQALPLGFLERTKKKGLVHVGWVPQQLILEHESVGCYFCHAGFSSLIEAIVNDCQLVLLPQKGDQFLNARLVGVDGLLKSGVEVDKRDEDGYFGKEDVAAAVRTVMADFDVEPGMSIRMNHKKWQSFLKDKDVQDKFISNMVVDMKKIASDSLLY